MRASILGRTTLVAAVVLAAVAVTRPALAEDVDVVEGRLTLSVSYGFLAQFFQHQDVSASDPEWGHGVFMRLGGERCGAVCLGISILGSVMIDPAKTGSLGVGPHIATSWEGPSWGGPYSLRFGIDYTWLRTSDPSIDEGGNVTLGDAESAHGLGGWLSIDLELLPRTRAVVPLIGIRGLYVAVLSTDPINHHVTGQVVFGLSVGRRLVFGEEEEEGPLEDEDEELDVPDEDDDDRMDDLEEDARHLRRY